MANSTFYGRRFSVSNYPILNQKFILCSKVEATTFFFFFKQHHVTETTLKNKHALIFLELYSSQVAKGSKADEGVCSTRTPVWKWLLVRI